MEKPLEKELLGLNRCLVSKQQGTHGGVMKLTVQSPCINHSMQILCQAKSRISGKVMSEEMQQIKEFPEEFSAQIMHIV